MHVYLRLLLKDYRNTDCLRAGVHQTVCSDLVSVKVRNASYTVRVNLQKNSLKSGKLKKKETRSQQGAIFSFELLVPV